MFAEFATGVDGGRVECSGRLLRALDDPRRRATLAALADAGEPIPVAELAARVAGSAGVGDGHVRGLLHHQDLPILAAADLVERTPAGVSLPDTVREDVETVLDRVDRLPTGTWSMLVDLLSDPLRRATVAELEGEGSGATVHVDRLAATLADRAGADRTRAEVAAELHHLHLPRLAETELLSYHADAGLVEYRGDSTMPEENPVSRTLAAVTDFQRALRERV